MKGGNYPGVKDRVHDLFPQNGFGAPTIRGTMLDLGMSFLGSRENKSLTALRFSPFDVGKLYEFGFRVDLHNLVRHRNIYFSPKQTDIEE